MRPAFFYNQQQKAGRAQNAAHSRGSLYPPAIIRPIDKERKVHNMYNEQEKENKNIEKAIAIILGNPELTLDELKEAIAYKKENNCYLAMSLEGEYEAYSKAAFELSKREQHPASQQQITVPLHEYLRLKAHETGRAIGINGDTIDYDCCCDL